MQRMLANGEIEGITSDQISKLRRSSQIPDTATFKDVDGNKYSLRNAHMGHNPEDAVSYWNRCGRYHGAKSQAVRKWMLDPNNYRLEYGPGNCSRGAKSKERYKKPRKPKNGKLPKGC
jgi:putative YD repeat-containing domain protein